MKAQPLVILGLTCFGVLLIAPSLKSGEAQPASPPELLYAKRAEALQTDAWNSGETRLPRADDGHFYADVVANGAPSHMLVDTGATLVALTGEDAEAMGITWDAADIKPVGKGANGTVYGFPVTLDSVQLGQSELRAVRAMVVPEGLGISLLGQSFLGRIGHVEMKRDAMVLGG